MQTTQLEVSFVPPQGIKTVMALGVQVDFLARSEDTNGAFSTYRLGVEPNSGSPFHVHLADDEAFYVLKGQFEFQCGERVTVLKEGAFVFLPRLMPHLFRNVGSEKGFLLGIGTPAGHEGFFEDASQLSMPPDLAEAMAVCQKHGMELVPPPMT